MAKVGRGVPEAPSENLKVVVIIFVAATVTALAAAVLLYTELRKQQENVVRAEDRVEEIDDKWQRELGRAESYAEKCLGDRDATPDGLDKTFTSGEDWKPVVLTDAADGTPESIADLVQKLRSKVISLREENNTLRGRVDDTSRAYKTKTEELVSTRQIKEDEIAKVREELENERRTVERVTEESEEKITGLREDARTLRSKLVKVEKANKRGAEKLKVEIENLKSKIQELLKPPGEVAAFFEFDGKILSASAKYRIATIDLGKRDSVRPGFVFDIYPPGRPQKDHSKGKLEIKDVEETVSTAIIIGFQETDPVMVGDQIYNPIYSRYKREKFALIGEFSAPQTAEWISEVITEHGGIPSRDVSDRTNYVVLGVNFEHLKDYTRAKEMGIEILRVETLQKFFGR